MATAPSSEAEASEIRRRGRRRLLGAVTLVMALVVFVPMILDNEPRPPRNEPSLAIPSKENAVPLPAPTPVAATAAKPAKAAPPAPEPASSSPAPQGAATPSSRAPQGGNGPESTASAEAATVTPAAEPRLEGFAVQVGAFKDEERLKQARAKLEAAGVAHYTERVDASGGTITRLRAGPFSTREAAEAARSKLQQGQVVSLP